MVLKFEDIRDSHEFRPILAEIEEAPVSPLGRFIFWMVIAIVTFFTLWVCIGQVDVVVTARGKVVPEGQVKTLQPLDSGVVTHILVKEGDVVQKGQIVMEIDPSTTQPALLSNQKNLDYANLEVNRLNAMVNGQSFSPGDGSYDPETVQTQMTLYRAGQSSLNSKLEGKEQQLAQVAEQVSALKVEKEQAQQLLQLTQAKAERLRPVRDIVPRQEVEAVEKDLVTYQHQLQEVAHRLSELSYRKGQIQQEMADVRESFRRSLLDELSQREKSRIEYSAKTQEIGFRNKKQQIVSPVSGVVDQIFIHTVGGVVTPAQKLMTIVPQDARLQIEAEALNQDIGYIHKGQEVTIKVDTYDYQKYGTIPGIVTEVSGDSHDNQKQGPVYTVRVAPKKLTLPVDGKPAPLKSGMSLSAEIKVDKRRIIEFFIYPLIKSLDDSFSLR